MTMSMWIWGLIGLLLIAGVSAGIYVAVIISSPTESVWKQISWGQTSSKISVQSESPSLYSATLGNKEDAQVTFLPPM